MLNPEHLQFIGRIYDAVLKPQQWDEIIDEFVAVTGAATASLQVLDPQYTEHRYDTMSARMRKHPNFDALMEYYFQELWKKEQQAYAYLFAQPDRGFIPEFVCMGFDSSSLLEQHEPSLWLREHFGIFYRIGSRLNTTNAWQDMLALQFEHGHGIASPEEIQFANLFLPHFAKAVELGREFTVLRSRFNAVLNALDYYQIGTFIVTEAGNVVINNKEAARILDLGDGIELDAKGRLRITSTANSNLHELICRVSATAKGKGIDNEKMLTINRRSGADPYIMTIAPMRDPEDMLEHLFRGAIVYVVDPTQVIVISTEGMAKLYGLTTAEDTICKYLVEGMTTQEIAEARNVSIDTVRTQIKSVMSKTRTKNRASLIRLALSVNLPIETGKG